MTANAHRSPRYALPSVAAFLPPYTSTWSSLVAMPHALRGGGRCAAGSAHASSRHVHVRRFSSQKSSNTCRVGLGVPGAWCHLHAGQNAWWSQLLGCQLTERPLPRADEASAAATYAA